MFAMLLMLAAAPDIAAADLFNAGVMAIAPRGGRCSSAWRPTPRCTGAWGRGAADPAGRWTPPAARSRPPPRASPIERSQAVLLLLSRGYFKSANGLREVRAAHAVAAPRLDLHVLAARRERLPVIRPAERRDGAIVRVRHHLLDEGVVRLRVSLAQCNAGRKRYCAVIVACACFAQKYL